ncbi:hypothetical protein NQ317_012380 [Molorchus minor]|uniref:Uncharacterized protein n=1 Tax=Molorchus minor TaxID=1323400 RepID=A0ABQ9IT74_9CUCU|nr:hypothetical protein NQ317_012380 [Molorchus minor]
MLLYGIVMEMKIKHVNEIAVLMINVTDGTNEVEALFKKINVTYKNDPKTIDYTHCNDAATVTTKFAVIFIALLNFVF